MGKRRVARGAAAAAIAAKRDAHVVPQLPYPGDPVKKGERSSLFRVLARTPFNSSVRATVPFFWLRAPPPPPRCGRLQLGQPERCDVRARRR